MQVKACAPCRPLLVCFDGWMAYIRAFRQVFRTPLREGQVGRPRLIPWLDLAMGQIVRRYARRRVVGIERRIIQGSEALVQRLVTVSQRARDAEHGLHRTLAGHLSESPGLSGLTGPQPGAHGEDPEGRHVSDGLHLQLLYLTREFASTALYLGRCV